MRPEVLLLNRMLVCASLTLSAFGQTALTQGHHVPSYRVKSLIQARSRRGLGIDSKILARGIGLCSAG